MEDPTAIQDLLALAALGSLDQPEADQLKILLAELPDQQRELSELEAVAASLTYSLPPQPMAESIKQRLWQRLNLEELPIQVPGLNAASVSDLIAQAARADWQSHPLPGVSISMLHIDLATREIYSFIRAIPGVRFSDHRHAGAEAILVLEGDVIIDGQVYESGACIRSTQGTAHQPSTQAGCLLLLQTSLDDEVISESG